MQLTTKRDNCSLQTKHLRGQQEEAQKRTKDYQKQLSLKNTRIKQLQDEKDQFSADRQELIKKKVGDLYGNISKNRSLLWDPIIFMPEKSSD